MSQKGNGTNYGDFGLQAKKTSREKGKKGEWYCPFCWKNGRTPAFSLCFANWVICPDCVSEGLQCFEKGLRINQETCDICNKKEQQVIVNRMDGACPHYACKPCLELAQRVVRNHLPNLDTKTNQLQLFF